MSSPDHSPDPDDYKGYREPMLGVMKRFGVTVWHEVRAHTTRGDFAGLVLPRSETSDAEHMVLKLVSGYNIGIRHDTIVSLEAVGYRKAEYKIPEEPFPSDPGKPRVMLLGTGVGTPLAVVASLLGTCCFVQATRS